MVVSNIFYFHPETWGNDPNLTCAYFSNGLVQPPTSYLCFASQGLEDEIFFTTKAPQVDPGKLAKCRSWVLRCQGSEYLNICDTWILEILREVDTWVLTSIVWNICESCQGVSSCQGFWTELFVDFMSTPLWCQEIYWRRRRWQTGQRQKAPKNCYQSALCLLFASSRHMSTYQSALPSCAEGLYSM